MTALHAIASVAHGSGPYSPTPAEGPTADIIRMAEFRARGANLPVPPPFDCMSQDLGYAVTRRWSEPCEAAFEHVLAVNPPDLARLITAGQLAPGDLTFAAEILGRAGDGALVRWTLQPLLAHEDAAVREGAIYGLTRHRDEGTTSELRRLAASDPSAAVRTVAEDALDE